MQEIASKTPKEVEVKLEVDPTSLPALNKIPLFRTLKLVPHAVSRSLGLLRYRQANVAQEGLDVARSTEGWPIYPNN